MKNVENLKIAALLHDIGKFYQRTDKSHSEEYKKYSQDDYGKNGAHAKWSCDFLDKYYNDDIVDLVLYHHNHTKSNYPDLCSILKKADHHSASEREDIDDTQEVNKTPLISLFSKIVLEGNGKVDEQYIPLNKLSLDDGSFNNLKPAAKKDTMGGWNLVPEYNRLG
ncbi:HD domain-containing protein [uncultured Methanobrevibacter sp.]|uniref:HD domain-containing protein n=1 Tax=uncultured Methanobrevibacter sp. TaxID=253161 RepID=UPI0033905299